MNVYLLLGHIKYEGSEVLGIFKTKESASNFRDQLQGFNNLSEKRNKYIEDKMKHLHHPGERPVFGRQFTNRQEQKEWDKVISKYNSQLYLYELEIDKIKYTSDDDVDNHGFGTGFSCFEIQETEVKE